MKIEIKLPFSDNQFIEEIFLEWKNNLEEEKKEAEGQGNLTTLIPDMDVFEYYDEETGEVEGVTYRYSTCSKKGHWLLNIDYEKREVILTFNGYRNSFLGGNLFMEVTEIPLYPEAGNRIKVLLMDVDGNEHVFEGEIISYETSMPEKPLGFSKKLWSAVRKFAQEHPRLFNANSRFFKHVLENDAEIEKQLV
ncbi:MAG: hypothetical protein ACTSXW_08530, partial [Candidatus Baldrarchaeia archaeon]